MLDRRVPFSRNVVYETLRQFPVHDMPLRRVKVSSLVLAGDSDDIIPRDGVAEFALEIGARVKWYAANHALPWKKPGLVKTAIDKFFSAP